MAHLIYFLVPTFIIHKLIKLRKENFFAQAWRIGTSGSVCMATEINVREVLILTPRFCAHMHTWYKMLTMIGIDLVFIPELQKQLEIGGQTMLDKAFSSYELQNQKLEHLAGLWAAKEATMKAAGLKPGAWKTIQISYDDYGRPFTIVEARRFEISISHHGDYAVAVARDAGI